MTAVVLVVSTLAPLTKEVPEVPVGSTLVPLTREVLAAPMSVTRTTQAKEETPEGKSFFRYRVCSLLNVYLTLLNFHNTFVTFINKLKMCKQY